MRVKPYNDGTGDIIGMGPVRAKPLRYEIINHGYEHAQYFQGCSVAYTEYDHVATGCGNSAAEAYDDALELIASEDSDIAQALPQRPRGYGITKRAHVPAAISKHEDSEVYWYVSIRWTQAAALKDARG